MNRGRCFFIFIFIFFNLNSYADRLEKGFEKLRAFDYFSAKEYFEKTLDADPAAAAFGLSAIYAIEKNPFYNTDSARKYILISDSTFKLLKERDRRDYSELGVNAEVIDTLKSFICEDAFAKAEKTDAVETYNHYISTFTSCRQFSEVILLRNAAAFNDARVKNNSTAYREFMALYPQALQYKQAQSKYDELIYDESTLDHTIQSYENFLINYPESPYRSQAEKTIYSLTVPDKTLSQYETYVRKYKDGRFSTEAWHEIYKLSMKDFSINSFERFKQSYPDYPFPEELESDFLLQNYFFLPVKEDNKWGYINEFGQQMIKPAYDEVTLFSEGLAIVSYKGKYGFINKAGKKIVDFQFSDAEPFHNGVAVVKQDSLYGLVNRNGDFLVRPKYEELTEAADDIYMAVKNDVSGYIHKNGDSLSEFTFDLAGDFKKGYAIVNKNEKFGLLNGGGFFNIEPKFSELVFVGDNLLKALTDDEVWGIINVQGDTILPFEYDAIGEFNEHRALIAKKGKCGYVNEQGVIVIPLTFTFSSILLTTGQFQNGYALLKQKYKSVIIDSTGKAFSIFGYDNYGRPGEGFIPVRKNKKWGYADMNKKIRIPCKFEEAETFKDGFAIVHQNKLAGLIDTTGSLFIAPMYEDITVMEKSIVIRSSGKSGLFSRDGILLTPCQNDKIEFLSSTIAKATYGDVLTYINLENGKIIYNSLTK